MRKLILVCAVVLFSGVGARDARAEGALSFVIGAGFGGNFSVLSEPDLDLATAFKNSPLYGVRIGGAIIRRHGDLLPRVFLFRRGARRGRLSRMRPAR